MKRTLIAAVLLAAAPAFAQVQYREDDPHVSGQYGTAFWCVRQDTAAALAANGDYIPCIVGPSGHLWTLSVQSGSWTVAATQSGTWSNRLTDGTLTASIRDTGSSDSLNVAIVDASGNQVTSFGGGTQYTEGDTDATITGSALLWEDAADTLRAVSVAKPLPTRISDGTDQVLVSGSGSLQVTCDNCGGASPFEDEDAFTVGTSSVVTSGFLVDDTTPDSAPEDSAAAARMSANRNQYVQIRDISAERSAAVTAANALKVDGSAVTQPVSGTVTVTDGSGALNTIVDSGTLTCNAGSGTFTVGDGSGALNVIVDSGTTAVTQATASNLNAEVQGDAAHDATLSGNPVLMGGASSAAAPADVSADGEAVRAWHLRNGAAATVITAAGALIGGDATNGLDVDVTRVGGTVTVSDGAGAMNVIVDSGTLTANQGGAPWSVAGPAADGAAVSGNPVRIAGKDGSGNTQDIITDTSGELQVDVLTLPSVTIGTFPDNEPINVAQMNGVAVTMGNGASGTGVQRVTLADDSTGEVRIADNAGNQIASNTAAPATTDRGLVVRMLTANPCQNEIPTAVPIDIVTATTVLLATGVSSQHVYICSLNLITAGANNVAIVSGTGATCGTSTAGIMGGATAGEGWNLAANGGIVLNPGDGFHARTETAADSVCVITSAAVQLSGSMTYVIE